MSEEMQLNVEKNGSYEQERLIGMAELASKAKCDFDAAMRAQKVQAVPALTKDYAAIVSYLSDRATDSSENEDSARAERAFRRVLGGERSAYSDDELADVFETQAKAWGVMSSLYEKRFGKKSKGNALYVFAEEAGLLEKDENGEYKKLNVKKNMEALQKRTALPEKVLLKYNENIRKKKSTVEEILSWVYTLAAVVAIVFVVRTFVFEPIRVDGTSMTNTLPDNAIVYSSKLDYLLGNVERGDVVICHYPGRTSKFLGLFTENTRFVKRVVAVPGDKLEIRPELRETNGSVKQVFTIYVNDEPYLNPRDVASVIRGQSSWLKNHGTPVENRQIVFSNGVAYELNLDYYTYTLGEDEYFVVGDNRGTSHDSRAEDVGPITRDMITGKVRLILWPLNSIGTVKNEAEVRAD